MLNNNVIQIPNINAEVTEKINEFLQINTSSKNTRRAYHHDIEVFYNKPLDQISYQDLNNTDRYSFVQFITDHIGKVSNSTIRRRISSVKQMLKYLGTEEHKGQEPIVKNINYLNGIGVLVKKRLPMNDHSHGQLSIAEAIDMSNWMKKNERRGDIKKYLIQFALETGSRIGSCLLLKWKDVAEPDEYNEVRIHYVGKGNKDTYMKIPASLYQKILKLKYKYHDSDRVFPISESSMDRAVQNYCKAKGIKGIRNISFHSIRGTAADFAYESHGHNILAAKKKLNHASVTTTQRYTHYKEVHADGVISVMDRVDQNLYKKVPHKMLLQALEKVASVDLKLVLNNELNKINKITEHNR